MIVFFHWSIGPSSLEFNFVRSIKAMIYIYIRVHFVHSTHIQLYTYSWYLLNNDPLTRYDQYRFNINFHCRIVGKVSRCVKMRVYEASRTPWLSNSGFPSTPSSISLTVVLIFSPQLRIPNNSACSKWDFRQSEISESKREWYISWLFVRHIQCVYEYNISHVVIVLNDHYSRSLQHNLVRK